MGQWTVGIDAVHRHRYLVEAEDEHEAFTKALAKHLYVAVETGDEWQSDTGFADEVDDKGNWYYHYDVIGEYDAKEIDDGSMGDEV